MQGTQAACVAETRSAACDRCCCYQRWWWEWSLWRQRQSSSVVESAVAMLTTSSSRSVSYFVAVAGVVVVMVGVVQSVRSHSRAGCVRALAGSGREASERASFLLFCD